MKKLWHNFCGMFVLSASLFVLGCGTSGNTFVRTVNASPGLTGYNVQVGPTIVVYDVPYGTEGVQQPGQDTKTDVSGLYRPIGAGEQTIQLFYKKHVGLTFVKRDLVKNANYTIVNVDPPPYVHFLVLADNNSAPTKGNFKLRAVNVSHTAGPVDVYLTAPGASLAGATPILSNFLFGQVTQTYFQFAPGSYDIQVTPYNDPANVLAIHPFIPVIGRIYTLFALDPPPGSTAFGLLVTNERVSKPAH